MSVTVSGPGFPSMRTLVDLLNDDHGFVRIYAEAHGFAYEKSTHRPVPTADLFDRMDGFSSKESALAVAHLQLRALPSTRRQRPSRSRPR